MAWWLALALVVAPALGRMNEVLHAPTLPQTHVALSSHGHGYNMSDLFGEHSVLKCLALDQLSHGYDRHTVTSPMWPILPQSTPWWSAAEEHLPAATSLFQARAPPCEIA